MSDEKEGGSVIKFPSREINAEDDFKSTILNLSKQILELQREPFSTSFQHHRFYSNSDQLRLKNDLSKSCHSHSQSTKRLKSQVYTKKNKKYSNFSHQFHKKHKKSISPVIGPISPVRETISPVREQRKSSVRQLSLSSLREDQSRVIVATKTSKKRQGESNDPEKKKKDKTK